MAGAGAALFFIQIFLLAGVGYSIACYQAFTKAWRIGTLVSLEAGDGPKLS